MTKLSEFIETHFGDSVLDGIELENDDADVLTGAGIDVMSDPFLELSSEEMAKVTAEKKREEKERKAKEREDAKRKAEVMRRIAHLNDNDAYNQYSKLMQDFPDYDDIDVHWSGNLVRILHIIKYQHSLETLANSNKIVGEPEDISYIAIVKHHLSLATFDDIWNQMREYVLDHPEFVDDTKSTETVAVSYTDTSHKLDENAESSSDPDWGRW
jgi:hypothetical protein